MIFDNIKNMYKYNFDNDIKRALETESKITADNYSTDTINLPGGDFLLPRIYNTQIVNPAVFEAHKEYIDVMYMVEGSEIIKVQNIYKLKTITSEYSSKDDVLLAECDNYSEIYLSAGEFIVLYPQDAHCPACAAHNTASPVKKVIGKVKIKR